MASEPIRLGGLPSRRGVDPDAVGRQGVLERRINKEPATEHLAGRQPSPSIKNIETPPFQEGCGNRDASSKMQGFEF